MKKILLFAAMLICTVANAEVIETSADNVVA